MEEYTKYFERNLNTSLSSSEVETIKSFLKNNPGISMNKCTQYKIQIWYNPYLLSKVKIIEYLSDFGIESPKPSKKKSIWSRWLLKLGNSNKKYLGNQQLDCCKLNH